MSSVKNNCTGNAWNKTFPDPDGFTRAQRPEFWQANYCEACPPAHWGAQLAWVCNASSAAVNAPVNATV